MILKSQIPLDLTVQFSSNEMFGDDSRGTIIVLTTGS